MKKISRFLKTAFIYFSGNMLSKMVAFFLLPLYTSRLLPEQYGTYDLVLSLINLVAPIAFFQIWDGMFRFAFDYKEEKEKYGIISNSLVTYFGGIGIYILLFSLIGYVLKFDHFYLAMIYGFFFALQYFYTYVARVFLRNKLFVISGTVNTLISAILNIILIVKFNWGVESLYLSPTIGCIVQIIIIEVSINVIKYFDIKKINRNIIKELLKFSFPLCIATVSYWLLSGFSKVIITYILGSYDNGLYAVANRFASIITLVVSVFQFAWNEMAYLMANDDNRENAYSICVDIILKVVFYGCAITCLGIKIIFPFMVDASYNAALSIIPAAIIGVSMNSVAGFLGTLFMTEKKTIFILYSTIVAAMINCIGSYFCAKYIGLQGVVVVLAIAFTVLMLLRLSKLRKSFKLRISKRTYLDMAPLIISIILFYCIDKNWQIFIAIIIIGMIFFYSFITYVKKLKKRNVSYEYNEKD